ncbi:glycosyltransferase N-terminal domain-containing protein [Tropicimonas sp. TH_r6]|uniref:3-deoxy-D-manno-octulosonic acid transferase n=1 Tax=Tropicimonas sp. TH_r6 TaxID=3082085 RepID=UPI002955B5F2|nr:glycosyltransferase N-terminal domain-containing protein [Tropicimonas sp. TH_r6]MDV7143128.1 glycosyltransferase N-terminal domain-containing protein [Tropicimonas sp. TH_r6]
MLLYRFLLTLLAPVFAALLLLRRLKKRENRSDLGERLGRVKPLSGDATILWLHGASNGELTSARELIEALLRRNPRLRIHITANTVTGRDMARSWRLPRVTASLAPLDFRACLHLFLARIRPDAFLLLEGDLWPNRFAMAAARGLPVAMVSARISAGSFKKWCRLGGLAAQMIRAVTLLSAQDAASEARFRALGLPEAVLLPRLTLKSSVLMPPPGADQLAPFQSVFDRAETLLAASTHAGEEEQVLAAFQAARATRPNLRLILAPRHVPRSDEVAALLAASGLRYRRRSTGDLPDADCAVYLADTMGEMALWYALAGQCFVGGSLVDKGGHTPFEPAQFDCAILHGPFLSNFAEPFDALAQARGALAVADAEALGTALATLDGPTRAHLTRAARTALALDETGGMTDLLEQLEAALPLG